MAAFNKFQIFVEDLTNKVHDLFGSGGAADAIKIYLSNAVPDAALDAVKADLAEITAGNGYTAGGASVTPNGTRATGTYTLTGTKVVWTAAGGTIGPFQYVVLYNDTPAAPADPLVGWWDRGAALTLQDGETFSVKFNNSDTTGTIFTLA
jgi:hypothetical protein